MYSLQYLNRNNGASKNIHLLSTFGMSALKNLFYQAVKK